MADAMVRYARKHGKLILAIIGAVFAVGGMFATARADMDNIKTSNEKHSERLTILENKSASEHAKLDAIAEDVQIIKKKLIGDN